MWSDVAPRPGFEDEKLPRGESGADLCPPTGDIERGGASEPAELLRGLDGEAMFPSLVIIFLIVDDGFEELLTWRELGHSGTEAQIGNSCVLNGIKSRAFMMWVSGGLRSTDGVA